MQQVQTPRSTTRAAIKVLVVDDHPLIRLGIAELLAAETDMVVCGQVSTMQEALAEATRIKPEVAIIDVSLDGNNGIELMKTLSARPAPILLLAYSMHDEAIYAERALRVGAKGYVMKDAPPETLVKAVREIVRGKIHLSDAMSERLLGKLVGAGSAKSISVSPVDKLSDRELEVLQMLGKGLTTAAIADKLCLSVKTIETYREHLKQKLNLANGQELLRYAIEWSLGQGS